MRVEKSSPSVRLTLLKSPSHDMAHPGGDYKKWDGVRKVGNAPAANVASKSSLPAVLTTPAMKVDKARYCARYDCRSIQPNLCVYFMNLEKAQPINAPITVPITT
jgi:hypothetical protein